MSGELARGTWTLDDLMVVLTRAASTPGRKVLSCAQDVADALAGGISEADPAPSGMAMLMAVEITVVEAPPGRFQMVRHDHCEVLEYPQDLRDARVSHKRCTIVAAGTVT